MCTVCSVRNARLSRYSEKLRIKSTVTVASSYCVTVVCKSVDVPARHCVGQTLLLFVTASSNRSAFLIGEAGVPTTDMEQLWCICSGCWRMGWPQKFEQPMDLSVPVDGLSELFKRIGLLCSVSHFCAAVGRVTNAGRRRPLSSPTPLHAVNMGLRFSRLYSIILCYRNCVKWVE
jgi:hypothetical protein